MILVWFLLYMLLGGIVIAAFDYFQYQDMITEYSLWAWQNTTELH